MRPLLVAALAAVLLLRACGGGGGSSTPSLDEALAVEPEDRRDEVLGAIGTPDTFTIRFEELNGKAVRWESWNYHELGTRYDIVDGEVATSAELEPEVDGALYPHFYDPLEFEPGMSSADVQALLGEIPLTPLDVSESDVEGATVWAGEQILLGFHDDELVYVETVALDPEGA